MSERAGVIPATLSFLAIYNPSLSTSDETFEDQIVYYYSKHNDGSTKSRHAKSAGDIDESKEEKDEKLRQIGLAQGMVSFAKNFSNGKAVDCIETERSRIILHELELNWWLLASLDLTRLQSSSNASTHDQSDNLRVQTEYSAREICPPALLLQHILRAHRIFLLHQAPSLTDLFTRIPRLKLCSLLKSFWDGFIWNWDVLLDGNPAVDIFNGIKLAGGGELGIGVGEEEWGSGEREVLEGFIGRTDGLVDLVVSRFGDALDLTNGPSSTASLEPRSSDVNLQVPRDHPRPSDGVVFSGIGALTRPSIRSLSGWVDWLHRDGSDAYGVRDNPSSTTRRKRKKIQPSISASFPVVFSKGQDISRSGNPKGAPERPGIPPSIVTADKERMTEAQRSASNPGKALTQEEQSSTNGSTDGSALSADAFVKYLTLGVYGSSWGIPSGRPPVHSRVSSLRQEENGQTPKPKDSSDEVKAKTKTINKPELSGGYFLIGLRGEIEEDVHVEATGPNTGPSTDAEDISGGSFSNTRVMMRTLHVERLKDKDSKTDDDSTDANNAGDESYFDRLRVVVYIQNPFIFTFLFELQTDSLAIPSFYRSLHHQLGPLQRPLLASTSPSRVSQRLWEAAAPRSTASTVSNQPICDLVYDPARLTVHTTIPNIPEPGLAPTNNASPWTRVEALSVHSQILNAYTSTRRHTSELERTSKTSRGWWVVWMRLPPSAEEEQQSADANAKAVREAFLIRKASDYVSPAARKSSGRFRTDASGADGGENGGWSPGKLAEGIGIDARQYVEGLLSLNR